MTNNGLQSMLQPINIPNCHFWEHYERSKKIEKYLHQDGKHIANNYQNKYYHSVRIAILQGIDFGTRKGYLA